MIQKMRVGVIMGGKSAECEVSFNSGRTVADHLDINLYDIIPIFQTREGSLFILPWHFLHRGKITDFSHRLIHEAKKISWDSLKSLIDFMFIATHGQYAEDGTLQGMLEILNIPYLGSKVLASALSMDKIAQKKILTQAHIKVPRYVAVKPEEIIQYPDHQETILEKLATANISFPCIVKPHKEGSSLGVSMITDASQLPAALMLACTINPHAYQTVLIEEKITGMEFSCIVLTDKITKQLFALPPTEIIPEKDRHIFDYQQKYMPGRAHKRTPPDCSAAIIKKIQDTCVATTKALDLTTLSRIDGFVTHDNEIVIIDPNSLSGMDPASFLFREAAEINMSHTHVINHLIETECMYYGINQPTQDSPKTTTSSSQKVRVAILMGGDSNEKEISLVSGRNITYKLSPQKYDAIPLFVTDTMELYKINQSLLVRNCTQEIQQLIDPLSKVAWNDLATIADFVFIGLHGGKGENGSVQGALEMLNIPYNGSSVLTSGLCMDKYKTAQFLKQSGFQVPQELLISKQAWEDNQNTVIDTIEQTISYPLIVKPADDGCSVMVSKIKTNKELIDTINSFFTSDKKVALIEEFIVGMELTVGVIGNDAPYALPPSQTVVLQEVLSIEEKFLPGAGENQTPAPLPPDTLQFIQTTIANAYKILDCKGYARIDCFYQSAEKSPTKQERVIILEVNTLPGLTPATCIFHQAGEIGIKPMNFIDMIIELGFEQHRNRHHPRTTVLPLFHKQALKTTVI